MLESGQIGEVNHDSPDWTVTLCKPALQHCLTATSITSHNKRGNKNAFYNLSSKGFTPRWHELHSSWMVEAGFRRDLRIVCPSNTKLHSDRRGITGQFIHEQQSRSEIYWYSSYSLRRFHHLSLNMLLITLCYAHTPARSALLTPAIIFNFKRLHYIQVIFISFDTLDSLEFGPSRC